MSKVTSKPNKKHIITRNKAYHGSTYLTGSITGKDREKNNFEINIEELSSKINKKTKLIILNKENKSYSLNTDMIEQKILDLQISNLSKFLSKFSLHFSKNRLFIRKVSTEKIKQDVEGKTVLIDAHTKFADQRSN